MPPSTPFADATWIASPVVGGQRTTPPAPYLRKVFALPKKPVRSARLAITALGIYDAEINGHVIGDQLFAPGWTDYAKRVQYQVHDLTKFLHAGENVLGVILGDGWYCGALGWEVKRQVYGDRPRLLARLEVTFKDGSTTSIVTDESWKTVTGPILESDFLMGESYDARLELGAWSSPRYKDTAWNGALAMPAPKIELDLADGPPVRRLGTLKAKPLKNDPKGNRLFDLGQNFTGRVRLTVKAKRGTTIKLRFAEILNPDGSAYTDNLRGARATDFYTCKGGGVEVWEARFTFHGFRYVELGGAVADIEQAEVLGIVIHSDTKPTGHFACSNPLLNKLQSNITWGQRSNFLEVPTDCPQRDERLGWTGDAQVFIRTSAFNMDVRGFFHKWMRDVRDSQSPQGAIPPVVPLVVITSLRDGGPAWADAGIICPWTIYLCYGDKKILADNYDMMAKFLAYVGKKTSHRHIRGHPDVGLWGGFGDWLALDGGGKLEGITPKDLLGTAFYAYDAGLMAKIADILGKKDDAKQFADLQKKVTAAFQRRFVTADGLIVGGTQTAYVLALHFDLLPEKLRAGAAKFLAKHIEEKGFHLATGFVGTPYILDVLERFGHLDVAYKLLEQETFPSWLFPVKNGATTIWERWDGWTPEKGPGDVSMNSYNHYAYGAVGAWMYGTVAGLELDPEQPGYRHINFRPCPGGSLKWAEAALETPYGKAAIHWEQTKTGLKLDLTVPPKCRATLSPPAGYGKVRTLGSGRHRLALKKSK